jgi:predicted extracellular nuclease
VRLIRLFVVLAVLPVNLAAQDSPARFRVMFYNVENYFDPFDDPATKDEEFTPDGARSWTYSDFLEKAVRISRVILAAGNPDPPAIIGLAEVENRFVLEKLVYETPLKGLGYRIIHEDSPDSRGIDVAMIYRKHCFRVDTFYYRRVNLGDTSEKTRDILVVRGVLPGEDTLTLIVNHWPSRFGGAAGSEYKRKAAAGCLVDVVGELFESNPGENIIVMGDFNDEPGDPSLMAVTDENCYPSAGCLPGMSNLMPVQDMFPVSGTIKHEGHWYFFDQLIVSGNLLEGKSGLGICQKKAAVLSAAFLLETDNSHLGVKPFRSFLGPADHHGFSDHLPVMLDIMKN